MKVKFFLLIFLIFLLNSCFLTKSSDTNGSSNYLAEESNDITKNYIFDSGIIAFQETNITPQIFSKSTLPSTITISWSLLNNKCPDSRYNLDIYLSKDNQLDSNDTKILQGVFILNNNTLTFYPEDPEYQVFLNAFGGKYNIIFDAYCTQGNPHALDFLDNFTIKTKWTFMVYMDGDNTLNDYTSYDLDEMKSIGSSKDVNIVVEDDTLYGGALLYYVKPGALELLKDLGEVNMGDEKSLVDFISWVMENYPADHYVVVLWDHGAGFEPFEKRITKNIALDNTSGDSLSIPELRDAFAQIYKNFNKKIDIIGMDACLMSMLEVAYGIKNYANYLVASENTEPASGWPYDTVLKVLINNPDISPEVFSKEIVKNYMEEYPDFSDQTGLSVIYLQNIDNLTEAVNNLASQLINLLTTNDTFRTDFENKVFNNVQRLDENGDLIINLYDGYVDLYNLAYLINKNFLEISNASIEVMNAFNATVIYSNNTGGDLANASGLSIWLPDSTVFSDYIIYYKELSFANSTQWDEFLEKFWE